MEPNLDYQQQQVNMHRSVSLSNIDVPDNTVRIRRMHPGPGWTAPNAETPSAVADGVLLMPFMGL